MQFPKDTTSILILAGLAVLLIMYLANNYLKDTVKDEIVEYEKKKQKDKLKKIKKNHVQQQILKQQQMHQQQIHQQILQQQMAQQNANINNEIDDLESYVDPLKNNGMDNFEMGDNMGNNMPTIGINSGNGGPHFQDQQNQMLNDRIFNN